MHGCMVCKCMYTEMGSPIHQIYGMGSLKFNHRLNIGRGQGWANHSVHAWESDNYCQLYLGLGTTSFPSHPVTKPTSNQARILQIHLQLLCCFPPHEHPTPQYFQITWNYVRLPQLSTWAHIQTPRCDKQKWCKNMIGARWNPPMAAQAVMRIRLLFCLIP